MSRTKEKPMQQAVAEKQSLVPVSVAAVERGLTRERLIRAVQRGSVRGAYIDGRWYVERLAS